MRWPPLVRARLPAASKGDLIMAMNRLLFGCAMLFVSAFSDQVLPFAVWGWRIATWQACGVALFAMLLLLPELNTPRRVLGLVLDVAGATIMLLAGGQSTAFIYVVYHWIIIGNGYRFGGRYAIIGSIASTLGFLLVMAQDPFWRENVGLSWGLLAGLVVLPAYSFVLMRELQLARKAAEQANKAKSLFLAGVSHELRTPLNAIVGTVDLLRATALDAGQRSMVDTISTAADSELSLVQDVLTFASMEAGQSRLNPTDFDLVATVGQVRALIESSARLKGLTFNTYIAARTPLELHGDERRIREVLLNICSNAVKFTAVGSVTLAVDGQPGQDGAVRLRFEVMDTGIGIEAAAQERIFTMFAQADDSILDRFGGTGLGLALCRRQIELMGGRIGVDSTPGIGSTFWINLDLACPASPAQPAEAAPGTADDGADGMEAADAGRFSTLPGGRTIEIVDDRGGLPPQDVRERFSTSLPARSTPADMRRALRIAAANAGTQDARPAPLLPAGAERLAGMTVLVADDNAINRTILDRMLTRAGMSVRLAFDGRQALDCLMDGGLDAALLDVNMPVMTGIETAKMYAFANLGERPVPLLALTADATPTTREQCLQAGMKACLLKPIRAADLIAALTVAIPDGNPSVAAAPVAADAVAPTGDTAPIDVTMLANLEELGGDEFVQTLIREFEQDGGAIVRDMKYACATLDLTMFRNKSHSLASISGNMGAAVISELCLGWQGMPEARFMQLRQAAPDQLDAAWATTMAALAAWQERGRQPPLRLMGS